MLAASDEELATSWCPGPESNRYVPFGTRDFKSRASASFATRAGLRSASLQFVEPVTKSSGCGWRTVRNSTFGDSEDRGSRFD
jgi:hypothetical protein